MHCATSGPQLEPVRPARNQSLPVWPRPAAALVLLFVFQPLCAFANTGTPMLWASVAHLALGNVLLGCLEGALLAKWFGVPYGRAIRIMILANYLSAWVGFPFMQWLHDQMAALQIAREFFVLQLLLAYGLTLVLEWPFVAWIVRGIPNAGKVSVKGSLGVQTLTYLLLFCVYAPLSNISLLTRWRPVSPDRLPLPSDLAVFYIAKEDGRVRLMGANPAEDVDVGPQQLRLADGASLELAESPTDTNTWALMSGKSVVLDRLISRTALDPYQAAFTRRSFVAVGPSVYRVGQATNSAWRPGWMAWPEVGAWFQRDKERISLGWGTPLGGWSVWRVIAMPGDLYLVVLGDQICLANLAQREITVLRYGPDALAFLRDQIEWAEIGVEASSRTDPVR